MDTDRELLELAAKAGYGFSQPAWAVAPDGTPVVFELFGKQWDPLTDDGDALRLTVDLGIEPRWYESAGYAVARVVPPSGDMIRIEEFGDDRYAATRRAIVRAAAEIGRVMK